MSQNSANDKAAMLAKIETINHVDGFDPTPFAVDYTDLSTGETRKRLPVMIQIAWFLLKHPEGKLAVQVTPVNDRFVATARVYPHYTDPVDAYLAEATASRGVCEDKPTVSPMEWAQTAAVGIALRNAGFGLQFSMAGEDVESMAADEFGNAEMPEDDIQRPKGQRSPMEEQYVVDEPVQQELTEEEKLDQAMQTLCPITKFRGKTLGEVLTMDPGAIKWIAMKFTGDENIKTAAALICEYALQQATA